MCLLETEATYNTPEIYFDLKKGFLRISGRSVPDNAIVFYKKLVDWITLYSLHPAHYTNVVVEVGHLNSMSFKSLLQIFEYLVSLHKREKTYLNIKWFYQPGDAEIEEDIQIFSDILGFAIEKRTEAEKEALPKKVV